MASLVTLMVGTRVNILQAKARANFSLRNIIPVRPVEQPSAVTVRPGAQEGHEGLDKGQAARGHSDSCVGIDLDRLEVEGNGLELDQHDDEGSHEDDPHQEHA